MTRRLIVAVATALALAGVAGAAASLPPVPVAVSSAGGTLVVAPAVTFPARGITVPATDGAVSRTLVADRPGSVVAQVRTGLWSWSNVSSQELTQAGPTNVTFTSFNEGSRETYRVVFTGADGSRWTSRSFSVTFTG